MDDEAAIYISPMKEGDVKVQIPVVPDSCHSGPPAKKADEKCNICEQKIECLDKHRTLFLIGHLCKEHLFTDGFACSECFLGSHKRDKVASHVQHHHVGTNARVIDKIVEEPLLNDLLAIAGRCFPDDFSRIEAYLKKKKAAGMKERKPRAKKKFLETATSDVSERTAAPELADGESAQSQLLFGGIELFPKASHEFSSTGNGLKDASPTPLELVLKGIQQQGAGPENHAAASGTSSESLFDRVMRLEAELVDERNTKKQLAELCEFYTRVQSIEQYKNALLSEQNTLLTKMVLEKLEIDVGNGAILLNENL
ncbi:unnamed protein product, partial [Mesorhabditis belari]|uniref:Uncharacterized protein n=1 Tax=Mesorhabditis belari TaxID=2138241 RepID=A0AAF3FQ29_9BILA